MRIFRLIIALLLATPIGSLAATALLLFVDTAQWERPAGSFYSTGEMLIFGGVLMTLVSVFPAAAGLALIALPLTLLLHGMRIPAPVSDLIVIAGLGAGGLMIDLGLPWAGSMGVVYGICAGIAWAAMLRLLHVRRASAA